MNKNLILIKFADLNLNLPFSKNKLRKIDKNKLKKNPNLIKNLDFRISRAILQSTKIKSKISISHKNGFCAIAFYKKDKIGIDVEKIKKRNFNAIIDFCFNEDEKEFIKSKKDFEKEIIFYMIYTAKESLIKANNLGFEHLLQVGYCKEKNAFVNHRKKIFFIKHLILNNNFICSICSSKNLLLKEIL